MITTTIIKHSPLLWLACVVIILDFPIFIGLTIRRLPQIAPLFQRGDRSRWTTFWVTVLIDMWLVASIIGICTVLSGIKMAALGVINPDMTTIAVTLLLIALFSLWIIQGSPARPVFAFKEPGEMNIQPQSRSERLLWLLLISPSVAICEEFAYRGFLQAFLGAWIGIGPALLIQALLYSLHHNGYKQGTTQFLSRVASGFILGLGTLWTGSLLLAMVVHFAYNAIGAILPNPCLSMTSKLGRRMAQ